MCWQCCKRAVERSEVVGHRPRPGRARTQYRPEHLVVGIACVHMSGDMNIVCDIKYAKPTGHVPQLFYDAWHDSRGRSFFRFLRIYRVFTRRGAGRTQIWLRLGLVQHSYDGWSCLSGTEHQRPLPEASTITTSVISRSGRLPKKSATSDVKTTDSEVETTTPPACFGLHDT